jgi:hypothetical protein
MSRCQIAAPGLHFSRTLLVFHVPVTCISKAFTFFELKKGHTSDRGATMNLKQAGLDFLEGYFSTHDRRKKTRAAYAIDLKQFLGFPNWTAFLEQQ